MTVIEMTVSPHVPEPELERQGRRLGRPGWWWLLLAAVLAIPGIVLIVFANGWAFAIGIVLVALASPPAAVGLGLLVPRRALVRPTPVICMTSSDAIAVAASRT
jgi:hypothetical protein